MPAGAITKSHLPRESVDVDSVRAQFPALASGAEIFLDGPGGTQTPKRVSDAVSRYFEEDNANVDGVFARSERTTSLVEAARSRAAAFFGAQPDEVGFGLNMTSLNFHLSRCAARELGPGDEVVVTRLDHDANIAPWLELAADRGFRVRFVDLLEDTTLDYDQLERLLSPRTRIVAFPWASNGVGTLSDVGRIVQLAHDVGALAWVDATHYVPHGPIDVAALDIDVLLCSAYKFFGPHLGLFYGKASVLEGWRSYKIRAAPADPVAHRFEPGTLPFEALAGLVAAFDYIEGVGWGPIVASEQRLGERFLAGLPTPCTLYGRPTMQGRVATFALNVGELSAHVVARALACRGIATWAGHYYAIEVMRRLGLDSGAVRIGFLHYNNAAEVDAVLDALADIAAIGVTDRQQKEEK
jgi:cysteine desulfurase family protein (TIGR01976 family)